MFILVFKVATTETYVVISEDLKYGPEHDSWLSYNNLVCTCPCWLERNITVFIFHCIKSDILYNINDTPHIINLGNICLSDRSWTASSQFSRCGWIWMDNGGTFNLWRQEISLDANQPCIRKYKHCGGQWRTCFNINMPELWDKL